MFQQAALENEELSQGTPRTDADSAPARGGGSPVIMASPILSLPRQPINVQEEEEDPGHQVHQLLQECQTLYEAVS